MTKQLTPQKVGEALGVTAETVRRWAHDGLIEHTVMPSGRIRIPASAVARLLPADDTEAAS